MPKRYTEDFKKMVLEMVASGKKPTDVSRELNISTAAIGTWIKKEKLKKETPKEAEKEKNEYSIEKYAKIFNENIKLKEEIRALKKTIEILIIKE